MLSYTKQVSGQARRSQAETSFLVLLQRCIHFHVICSDFNSDADVDPTSTRLRVQLRLQLRLQLPISARILLYLLKQFAALSLPPSLCLFLARPTDRLRALLRLSAPLCDWRCNQYVLVSSK